MFIYLIQRTLLAPLCAFRWTTAIASHLRCLSGVRGHGLQPHRPREPAQCRACSSSSLGVGLPWALGRVKAVPGRLPNHLEPKCYLGEVQRVHARKVLGGERWPTLLPSPESPHRRDAWALWAPPAGSQTPAVTTRDSLATAIPPAWSPTDSGRRASDHDIWVTLGRLWSSQSTGDSTLTVSKS